MPEDTVTTTAASLSRNFGLWQDKAMHQPVMVTHHGRPRAVLISVETYNRFSARAQSEPALAGDDTMVIDAVTQSFVALDSNFIVCRVNRAATIYFGCPAEDLLGQPLTALYPSLQDNSQARIFSRVMRTGQIQSFELPSAVYSGQILRVDAFPYRDGVGYLFQVIPDQEIRQQTAEADTLRALFAAHGSAGMARISLRGVIARADDTLVAMTGLSRDAVISEPLAIIVQPQDRMVLSRALENALEGKGASALPITLAGGKAATIAIAETRDTYNINGAAVLVTPRAPDT